MKETKKIDSIEEFEKATQKNSTEKYVLRLYVTGMTPKSINAIENITQNLRRKSQR